jgi:pyruvate formate lyase activating enzyme
LGGVLEHVLETIRRTHALGFWVEVVTLVIPGFNDSPEELMDAARFLASISPDLPWHVTAFHPDYHMIDPPPTTAAMLVRAAEIGQEAGLRYVYAGNLPGRVAGYENTNCPECRQALVERVGYALLAYRLTADGACSRCGARIPGVWPESPESVRVGGPADLYQRVPRPVP